MPFDDFLHALGLIDKNHKKYEEVKREINIAIHETEVFIQRRIQSNPNNVFGCENSECASVAKAWRAAFEKSKLVNKNPEPWLEGKLLFWSDKRVREEEQATSDFCKRNISYLSEIKEKL